VAERSGELGDIGDIGGGGGGLTVCRNPGSSCIRPRKAFS